MGHLQLKLVVFIFTQFPPFKHGSDAQISILFSQYYPEQVQTSSCPTHP